VREEPFQGYFGFIYFDPRVVACAPTTGLKLANAFGVIVTGFFAFCAWWFSQLNWPTPSALLSLDFSPSVHGGFLT
jgi:hypothetical protein